MLTHPPRRIDPGFPPWTFLHFEKEQETEIAGGGGIKICNTFDNSLVLIEERDKTKKNTKVSKVRDSFIMNQRILFLLDKHDK